MAKGVLMVQSRPSDPSRLDEFTKWYDEIHLPDLLAVPGIVGARRFRKSGATGDGSFEYLAIYDLDGDLGEIMTEVGVRVGDGTIAMSEAFEGDPANTGLFEAI